MYRWRKFRSSAKDPSIQNIPKIPFVLEGPADSELCKERMKEEEEKPKVCWIRMDNTGPPWRVLSVEDDNFQRWFNGYPPEGVAGLPEGFNLEHRKGEWEEE